MNDCIRFEDPDRPARAAGLGFRTTGLAPAIVRAICCASLLFAGTVRADSLEDLLEGPLETLTQAYLECNDRALQGLLGPGEAGACSMIYEAVKRRMFDGDFDRLVAWSRNAEAQKRK